MRKTLAVVCVALLALGTLGACGENDEETAKANIQEGVLTDDSASGGAPLSEDQAECFADGMVDKLGVEKLQDYGLLDDDLGFVGDANPTDMSADDAEAAAGVLTDCVDFGDLLRSQLEEQGDVKLTDAQLDCITDTIDEKAIREGLAAVFQGQDEDDNPLADSMGDLMTCLTGAADTE